MGLCWGVDHTLCPDAAEKASRSPSGRVPLGSHPRLSLQVGLTQVTAQTPGPSGWTPGCILSSS